MSEPRVATCLRKLDGLLAGAPYAVCGGVAVELALAGGGTPRRERALNDLDVLVPGLDALAAERCGGWLLSHFHRPQPGYDKRFVQLVDRETRLRVDLFDDAQGRWCDSELHRIGDRTVRVLAARQVLAHKRRLLASASAERTVDPKHLADARLLAELLGERAPEVAEGCVREDVYCTDLAHACARCAASLPSPSPLAAKAEIFALLGYV